MNKSIINEYKTVFDFWLDGGKVLYRDKDDRHHSECGWMELTENANFFTPNCIYVQNDEYVTFRRALADGGIVQYFIQGKWRDTDVIYKHGTDCSKYYRVQSDEPKFKKGDWVRWGYKILLLDDGNDNTANICASKGQGYRAGELKHWSPQEGDSVVWLDQPTPRLKVLEKANVEYAKSLLESHKCIPYIGQQISEMR